MLPLRHAAKLSLARAYLALRAECLHELAVVDFAGAMTVENVEHCV